jgi:hypothetical protein
MFKIKEVAKWHKRHLRGLIATGLFFIFVGWGDCEM